MENRVITLGGKEHTLRMDRRATFRLSAMGYQTYDAERSIAWMCAMIAAMIDTPKQVYSAEQVFELMDDLSEDEVNDLMEALVGAVDDSSPGKPAKKSAKKRASGRGSGSKRK